MTKEQQNVARFMRFFGQNIPERPTALDEETSVLRAKLTLEEAFEKITKGLGLTVTIVDDFGGEAKVSEEGLKQISFQFKKEKDTDLVELADGISDVNFVNLGDACASGLDMEPIDAEVSRSNESKAWSNKDLSENLSFSQIESGEIIVEEVCNGAFRRVKRSDGKIIKSPSYLPANVAGELEKQGWNK
jgi:predicted HAD superfamily Cof-like phosphohydrolase